MGGWSSNQSHSSLDDLDFKISNSFTEFVSLVPAKYVMNVNVMKEED